MSSSDLQTASPSGGPDSDVAPAPSAVAVGQTLSGYKLLKLLGAGGMGMVFLAEDSALERQVALKVMRPDVAKSPQSKHRFLREAKATAKVKSDHVISIHQAGEDKGCPFLAMELLKGETLDHWLRRGRKPTVPQILKIAKEITRGLAAAHASGLVHRDVKPANIWLEAPSGRVKILDFGLARDARDDLHITNTGAVLGTPAYMAPEQARAEAVDARTDLFSLGGVMYRMATGRVPFEGETLTALMTALAMDDPTMTHELNPAIPEDLSGLIQQLLAKEPKDRPASADYVLRRLSEIETARSWEGKTAVEPKAEATEHERTATDARSVPSRARASVGFGRARTLAVAGLVGLVLLTLALVTLMLRSEAPTGMLMVQIDDPTAKARIGNGTLVLSDLDGTVRYRLSPLEPQKHIEPGPYRVRVEGADGLTLNVPEFTLNRGEYIVLRITADRSAETKAAESESRFTNSLGMPMVLLRKGKFLMGGGGGNPGTRVVEIKHDFYLGQYEATQWEWIQLMGANPSSFADPGLKPLSQAEIARLTLDELQKVKDREGSQKEQYWRTMPVDHVSWDAAQEFVKRLNQKEKEPGWFYRLPTDAEWEFACRGGGDRPVLEYAFDFYFDTPTNTLLPDAANFNSGDKALRRTCKVGSYKPNRLGLYDMHGNVWEWCQDEVPGDPTVPNAASQRMQAGGGYEIDAVNCRATSRAIHPAAFHDNNLGFRLARVPVSDRDARTKVRDGLAK